MKIRILFVMPTMQVGGSVRNFLSLVSLLDPDKYEVTLLLFSKEGPLLDQIPENVTVEEFPQIFRDFQQPWRTSLQRLLFTHPQTALLRLIRLFVGRIPSFQKNISQKEWVFLRNLLPVLNTEYDVAIGYLQTTSVYYIAEKVKAKKKIGFVRNEYTKGKYDASFDQRYFQMIDYIGTVSQAGYDDLCSVFSHMKHKIRLIENVVSPHYCREMAKRDKPPFSKSNAIHIVSLGRLVEIKGFDMAIQALHILRTQNYPVVWHVLGSGPEEKNLKEQAAGVGLQNAIIFAGERVNPYPYVLQADIYVQTSRSEGWCIALQEALVLGKACVTTNFATAYEQIEHLQTGVICEMSAVKIAEAIKLLMDNPELKSRIEENVASVAWHPEVALQSFYEMIQLG